MNEHDGLLGGSFSDELSLASAGIEPYSSVYGIGESTTSTHAADLFEPFHDDWSARAEDYSWLCRSAIDESSSSPITEDDSFSHHWHDSLSMFADDTDSASNHRKAEPNARSQHFETTDGHYQRYPEKCRTTVMRFNRLVNYRHSKLRRWLTRHFPRRFPDRGYWLMDYIDQKIDLHRRG